jgi:hypothetical protein
MGGVAAVRLEPVDVVGCDVGQHHRRARHGREVLRELPGHAEAGPHRLQRIQPGAGGGAVGERDRQPALNIRNGRQLREIEIVDRAAFLGKAPNDQRSREQSPIRRGPGIG